MRYRGMNPPGLTRGRPSSVTAAPAAPRPDAPDAAPATPAEASDTAQRLRELQALHTDGVLTDQEYEERRVRLVEEL